MSKFNYAAVYAVSDAPVQGKKQQFRASAADLDSKLITVPGDLVIHSPLPLGFMRERFELKIKKKLKKCESCAHVSCFFDLCAASWK